MEIRPPSLNFVLVSGNLTKDPEFKVTSTGKEVLSMRIAVNRRVKDKTGAWKDEPMFFSVDWWGDLAAKSKDRLRKGSPIVVEGRLKGREYEDKASGQKRSVIDITANIVHILEKTGAGGVPSSAPAAGGSAAKSDEDLEEVPF